MASPHPVGYAAQPTATGPNTRPGALTAAVGAILLSTLCGIGTLIVTITGGKEALRPLLQEMLRAEVGDAAASVESLGADMIELVLDEAYGALSARAYFIVFFGVLLGLLALFIAGGRNWARITWIVCAVPALLLWTVNLTDTVPSMIKVFDGVALICTLAALVLVWVGGSNAYFRARKLARKG